MKKFSKKLLISSLIVVLMCMSVPIFTNNASFSYTVQAATIKLNKTKLTLNKGQTYTLKISGTKKTVKWSTSNKKIATVNSKGKVTAVKKGSVTITAKVDNQKYNCKINVEAPVISQTKYTMNVGDTYTLKVSGTSQKITWSSNNKKVATINSKGKVTAIKKGNATITAKVGSTEYNCKITVNENKSSTVYITNTGEKYHRDGCRYLANSKIKTTLKSAQNRGYTPCKVCKP